MSSNVSRLREQIRSGRPLVASQGNLKTQGESRPGDVPVKSHTWGL